MKVAVTYENGEVFQHFGRTPQFKVYEVEAGKILNRQILDTGETGHGALAGFLKDAGAEVLICGGIGGGAVQAMSEAGIKIYAGASGSADAAIESFVNGTLPQVGEATCDHHGHDHEGHDHEGHECSHGGGCHHTEYGSGPGFARPFFMSSPDARMSVNFLSVNINGRLEWPQNLYQDARIMIFF